VNIEFREMECPARTKDVRGVFDSISTQELKETVGKTLDLYGM
jgi:hypothetical protein